MLSGCLKKAKFIIFLFGSVLAVDFYRILHRFARKELRNTILTQPLSFAVFREKGDRLDQGRRGGGLWGRDTP